jgi:hypothetical protein
MRNAFACYLKTRKSNTLHEASLLEPGVLFNPVNLTEF